MLVQHWMTRDVVTVEADTPFLEARLLLKEKKIRHLPVVERGRLIGVITDRDLKQAAPSGATTLDVFERTWGQTDLGSGLENLLMPLWARAATDYPSQTGNPSGELGIARHPGF